jgi:hypothetical protein
VLIEVDGTVQGEYCQRHAGQMFRELRDRLREKLDAQVDKEVAP